MRVYLIFVITLFLLGCDQESKLNAHIYYINNVIGDRKIVSENQLLYPITIYPDVVEFVNDESFTLVKQVPSKDNSIVILGEHLYSMFKSYKNATVS